MKPIWIDKFYHDGRGPELQKVHWSENGSVITALDYFNPDDDYDPANLRRVVVLRPQVVMVTPEEVIDYGRCGNALARFRPAAMFEVEASAWVQHFSPRHLGSCHHYQLFFYDELFDLIAEGVECRLASGEGTAQPRVAN